MALDRRYLELHGNQWRVQMKVPEKLRSVIGKSKLVKPLKTPSLATANRDRWPIVAEFTKVLRDAEAALDQKKGHGVDPIVREALEWREYYQEALADPLKHAEYDADGELLADSKGAIEFHIDDRTGEISEALNPAVASLFNQVALGHATPVLLVVDDWLGEMPLKPRQGIDYRRAVVKFEGYLAGARASGAIEKVTRRVAGDYVGHRIKQQTHPRTLNKDVSCLSSYWRWLERRGYVTENVWLNQTVKELDRPKSEEPRPFTDEEMKTLLGGSTAPFLFDAMLIAALSGMRVEEIARLRVEDVKDGTFQVRVAKTRAGERLVPIHHELTGTVQARSVGKAKGDYLFPELPTPAPTSAVERSQKISKGFTRYRRGLGIDDRIEGQRQARTTFHSFRRWFITKAEMAGIQPHIISWVVGHARQGMTLGTYSGGPGIEQMKACVEAVKLP